MLPCPNLNPASPQPPLQIPATLLRPSDHVSRRRWHVLPVVRDGQTLWLDPAGYVLAESVRPDVWYDAFRRRYDFVLDLNSATVIWGDYVGTHIPVG